MIKITKDSVKGAMLLILSHTADYSDYCFSCIRKITCQASFAFMSAVAVEYIYIHSFGM